MLVLHGDFEPLADVPGHGQRGLHADFPVLGVDQPDDFRAASDELASLENQTKRLMRDMGFNLMIVHKETNMSDFWAADFAATDMPQEYVDRLAGEPLGCQRHAGRRLYADAAG